MIQPASPVRFALGGLVAMAVGMGIGRFIFTPILPGMMSDLGLTPGDAGLIASANYFGYLLGAIIAGFGWASGIERPLVYVSLAASAALCFAMSVSDGVMLFSIIRFFAGVASAFMLVFTATIVFSHLAAANRQDLQAMHFGGVGTGIAISSLLVAASSASGHGWREDWIGAAVLSALGLIAVVALIRQGPVRSGSAAAEPPIVWTPEFIKINIAYGLFGFGYIITATFIIAIVRSSHGSPWMEALVWFVTGTAGAISVWLWTPLLQACRSVCRARPGVCCSGCRRRSKCRPAIAGRALAGRSPAGADLHRHHRLRLSGGAGASAAFTAPRHGGDDRRIRYRPDHRTADRRICRQHHRRLHHCHACCGSGSRCGGALCIFRWA